MVLFTGLYRGMWTAGRVPVAEKMASLTAQGERTTLSDLAAQVCVAILVTS